MKPVRVMGAPMQRGVGGKFYRLRAGIIVVQVAERTDGTAWYCHVWIRNVCLTPHAAIVKRHQARTAQGAATKAGRLLQAILEGLAKIEIDLANPELSRKERAL